MIRKVNVQSAPSSPLLRLRGGCRGEEEEEVDEKGKGLTKREKRKKELSGKAKEKTMSDIIREKKEEDEADDSTGEDEDGEDEASRSQQAQFMTSIVDMWKKTPPITQGYIGSSVALTLLAFAINKNSWPALLNLEWKSVFMGFQWWRPITAFLFFGPFGVNYLLTIHFVWTYMAQLEKLNYKNPEEFFVMICFGAVSLLAGYTILGLSPKFLGHNLSTYLVYIWARIFEGTDVNVMDLFFLKAELLPWFFSAQTAILEGELPFADLLGIVVGHLYHYLTKQKYLVAPNFIKSIFSRETVLARYAQFKEDFE